MRTKYLILATATLLTVGLLSRLLPHAPNATATIALALIASRYLGRRVAVFLPLATLFLSDLVLGFYNWHIMLAVYGSFVLAAALSWLAKRHRSPLGVVTLILGGDVLFFLVTNGVVWLYSAWYAKTFAGLMYAYTLGLPFLRNMFLGDLFYTALLIFAAETIRVFAAVKQPALLYPKP